MVTTVTAAVEKRATLHIGWRDDRAEACLHRPERRNAIREVQAAVRFTAAAVLVAIFGAPLLLPAGDLTAIVLLALVPGLLAFALSQRELAGATASRATLAAVLAFGTSLGPSHWVGAVTAANLASGPRLVR